MMPVLPVERALSTTFCISQGERNWPFLMLTGLPCDATFTMKFVWRQRKAGVCSTSTTAATSASGVSSCTSVSTGSPVSLRTRSSALRPPASPGPRKLERELRFALSKDALKMSGTECFCVISLRRPATSRTSSSLSMSQGPAIRTNGRSGPISWPQSFMRARSSARRARQMRGAPVARGTYEAGKERVPVARRRGEFGVILARDEPGMARQLDDLHQAVGREARELEARLRELLHVAVVEFVAVAMAFHDGFTPVGHVRERAARDAHFLRAKAHGTALDRAFVARLLAARPVIPLGDEGNDRVWRLAVEFGAVGALQAADIARVFHHRELHAKAQPKVRHAILAREADSL